MNVVFDRTALDVMKLMGYRYFCNKEIPAPELDPNEELCIYWELIPFKRKSSALKTYLALNAANENNGLWWDKEHLTELADGLFGLVIYIRISEGEKFNSL